MVESGSIIVTDGNELIIRRTFQLKSIAFDLCAPAPTQSQKFREFHAGTHSQFTIFDFPLRFDYAGIIPGPAVPLSCSGER